MAVPSSNVLLIAKLYFSLSLLSFAPYSTLATEQRHLNAIMNVRYAKLIAFEEVGSLVGMKLKVLFFPGEMLSSAFSRQESLESKSR